MKKILPYILAGLTTIAVILLIVTGVNKRPRVLDERISLRKHDKIPYGTFVAYEHLKNLFPGAAITSSRQEPGLWDFLSVYEEDQALIIICPEFNADKYEMKNLLRFVENGNDVFISTMELSYEAAEILNCNVRTFMGDILFSESDELDTLTVSLANPPFGQQVSFTYPGKQYDGYFTKMDTMTATILGYDKDRNPDFIHARAGKGNLYVHLAPMAFTNYFLLHKNNLPYYEEVFSLISPRTRKILWDEYYLTKKSTKRNQNRRSWLSSLMRYPGLRAGILTAILALLVYVLMEMRRKQRYIPIIRKPKNDSLDFVKTIGRLYHDKGDHHNLIRKMAAYFLEYVRNRYQIATTRLDNEFVKILHARTGVPEIEIEGIVSFIRETDQPTVITAGQLAAFHNQLESFYKKA